MIAYHFRQSFRPGEVTPEEANRIGVEFAQRFLKGRHTFIVCTHIDKAHTHNHIIWNSTTLDCSRKFRNFWGSTRAVRNLSDTICIEHSKKYLAEHESDIILHKAAKKAFDDFGLKKLPTVKSLNEEFARLLTEKKAAYADYHKTQEQMRKLMIHKANAAYLLGLEERKQQTLERQREEK